MSEQSSETTQPDFENESVLTWKSAVAAYQQMSELAMDVINILHIKTEAHRLRPTVFALAFEAVETGAAGTETDRVLREYLSAAIEFNACIDYANMLGNYELFEAILKLEGANLQGYPIPGHDDPNGLEVH